MRPVTIGIDARSAAGEPTGVGRYVRNLVGGLASLEDTAGITLRLYLPRGGEDGGRALPVAGPGNGGRLERRVLSMPRGPLLGGFDNVFTWNHLRLPAHLLGNRVDLLHAPFYTLPAVCPCPAVVTIHDITFDLFPEWFSPRALLSFGFAAASARRARHVLTVSECSRRDIIRSYGVSGSRVTAVPLAPDPEFRPVRDPGALREVREKYGFAERTLLHVGSITPRRNIPRLLDAFAALRGRGGPARDARLLLVGRVEPPSPPLGPEIARRGLSGAVRTAGYVEGRDLPALYSAASAVVYPSLYEGFGLPVLEAMACGTPVLASRTSSLPEVAGEAAVLVDPLDVSAMAEGLGAVLFDEPLRAELKERGRERAARFTWEGTARRTLEVYLRALSVPPPGIDTAGGRRDQAAR